MKLQLTRPIVFFDLETTGVDVMKDRIVEISMVKLLPDGNIIEYTQRVNPDIPIPEQASQVHHITNDDVANEPKFAELASTLAQNFSGCDIAGFNSNRFDLPLLLEEFNRAGVIFDISDVRLIDVQTIFHKKEPRNLIAAYKYYCDKDLTDAHSASADTMATYEVLMAQLEKYEDLPTTVDKLSEFSSQTRNIDIMGRLIYDDQNREVINFGKHKGELAEKVLATEPGYFSWIANGQFSQNTKDCFARIKKKYSKKRD